MKRLRRRIVTMVGAVLALGVVLAPPAAAQFEPALPRSESEDAIDIAVTPDGQEWWVAETDGQVATAPLGEPQVTCPPEDVPGYVRGMDRTPSGDGYWLVTSYGKVLTCGDAAHFGDLPTAGIRPAAPIVDIAATADGRGYWLLGSDGGVFTYGNAAFRGSTGDMRLNAPVVGIAGAGANDGYWLVATDGGVFTFGDATFHGSAGDIDLRKPVVDMTAVPDGQGYYLLGEDGGVFTFGDATFRGSRYSLDDSASLTNPFVGIDFAPGRDGYFVGDNAGVVQTFVG